jgi:hypothetical protein
VIGQRLHRCFRLQDIIAIVEGRHFRARNCLQGEPGVREVMATWSTQQTMNSDEEKSAPEALVSEGMDSAQPEDDNNSLFVSIFGSPREDKKRTLIQSPTEIRRNNPSLTNDSRRILFPSAGDVFIDRSDDLQHHPERSHAGDISVVSTTGSTPLTPSTASEARSSSVTAPRTLSKLSFPVRLTKNRDATIKGMRIFNQRPHEEANDRFREVRPILEKVLLDFLREKRTQFRPLTIELMMLGDTIDEAKPWIVVRCSRKAKHKVKKFLDLDFVRAIYHGDASCPIKFNAVVCESIKLLNSEKLDDVFMKEYGPGSSGAWTPQIKVMQSGLAHYATLGGVVCVVNASGTKSFYGLTTGHVLPVDDLYDDEDIYMSSNDDESDISDDGSEDDTGYYSDGCLSNAGSIDASWEHITSGERSHEDDSDAQEQPQWMNIGTMSKASYSRSARDRDWALIDVTIDEQRSGIPRATTIKTFDPTQPADEQQA